MKGLRLATYLQHCLCKPLFFKGFNYQSVNLNYQRDNFDYRIWNLERVQTLADIASAGVFLFGRLLWFGRQFDCAGRLSNMAHF